MVFNSIKLNYVQIINSLFYFLYKGKEEKKIKKKDYKRRIANMVFVGLGI